MNPNNPYLQPVFPDPFETIKQSQNHLREKEIEFQRLHYEILQMNKEGKRLNDMLQDKFVKPSHFNPNDPNASTLAIWWDGFRTAIRGLDEQGKIHAQRIKEGGVR